MKCTNCGKEVPDTAKVCGYCRYRLKETSQAVPAPLSYPPLPVRPKPPGWLWALLAGLVVLGILIVGGAILLARNRASLAIPLPVPVQIMPTKSEPTLPIVTLQVVPVFTATQEPVFTDIPIIVESYEDGDPAADIYSLATKTGSHTYSVNITSNTPLKLNETYCATTQKIFEQNLPHVQRFFFVDEEDVTHSMMQGTETNKGGWVCRTYRGIVRYWPVGQHTILYKIIFLEKVNNGEVDNKGEHTETFTIFVTP